MPIYAYRCASCGFQKDVLQKLSDAVLTICPSCHAESFQKQVTAAGFQLKGSGWYATDFRNPPASAKAPEGAAAKDQGADAAPSAGAGANAKSADATASSAAAAASPSTASAASTPKPSGTTPSSGSGSAGN